MGNSNEDQVVLMRLPEGLRRNPFQAFERRPGLRNAVRDVDITTKYDKPIKATDPTTLKALCHKEFSLFCNIRSISINGGYYEWADSSFLWCIVQDIETLQVLKLGDLSNSATLFFPNVKEFECRVWRPNKLGIGSYANRVHKLDFYSLSYDLGDFKPFSNLRVLILGRIKLPLQNGSLSVLASFPALTHLRLSPIIITSSLDFQHSYQPTNLTGLTHLTISLSQRDPTFIDSTLCWLVKSIAGHSRLTSLAITLATKEELCSVVRTVELRVRGTFVQGDEDDALALIVCRRQLSSLQNVHTVQINDNDDTGNISAILGAISGLEHVRSLKFTVNLRREREYPPLAHVKELDIRTWSLDPWNGTPFLDKIRTFKVAGLSTSFDHLQYIGMLSNFKELHLGVICISPGDLCRVLGSAPKLTHLHFKYHLHIFFVCTAFPSVLLSKLVFCSGASSICL
ncbi:hypothetical protein FRC20_005334 [Serendipita sp. 405]|nr:hypothetical protein FRC20_005334 [Serendipita sp. 405]